MNDERGHLRVVQRDGQPVVQLCCPGCGEWADLDDDQLHGRVSVLHEPGCGWHETHDWWEHIESTGNPVFDTLIARYAAGGPTAEGRHRWQVTSN